MAVPTTVGDAAAQSTIGRFVAAGPVAAQSVAAQSVTAKSGTANPQADLDEATQSASNPARPWITIVWNDPINLMSYVTHVFMEVFGYPKTKAEKLMMDVHVKGRAVVSAGTRERMELDVSTLHGYGLWATLQQDD